MSLDLHISIADGADMQRMLRDVVRKEKERMQPRHKQSDALREELDSAADAESGKTSLINASAKGAPPAVPVSDEDVSESSVLSLPKTKSVRKKSARSVK
jgi:hypothetical protein